MSLDLLAAFRITFSKISTYVINYLEIQYSIERALAHSPSYHREYLHEYSQVSSVKYAHLRVEAVDNMMHKRAIRNCTIKTTGMCRQGYSLEYPRETSQTIWLEAKPDYSNSFDNRSGPCKTQYSKRVCRQSGRHSIRISATSTVIDNKQVQRTWFKQLSAAPSINI